MAEPVRTRLRALGRRLAKEHATTPRLSAAVGVGAFVGSTPFFGFHTAIGLLISRLLKLNAIAVTLGTQVSLPFLAPFLVFASVQTGHYLLTGDWLHLGFDAIDTAVAGRFFGAWLLGSSVVGAGVGVALAAVTLGVLRATRREGADGEGHAWTGRSRGHGYGYALFFFIARRLGPRFGYVLLVPVTAFYFLADRRSRRASQDYFRRVLGPRSFWERQADTWRHFTALGRSLVDRLLVLAKGKSAFESGHTNYRYLEEALAEGDGAILLSAHFGSWAIAGAMFEGIARPNIVVYDNEAESIRRFFARHPDRAPPKLIVQNEGPTASIEILRALRQKEIVALLADRVAPGSPSLRVPFFGGEIDLPMGPFQLAVISGAPVAVSFGYKASLNRHEFEILPARRFAAATRAERGARIEEGARWFAAALEDAVRAHPYQWFNFFEAWREPAPTEERREP